ncbi:dihydrolipoamide acetyltransferase family protein [Streptomyces poonensis]|uniref:Dihydrolipoamide acetyltransferase component of pyruvate dehydrogenase complex n=1 Tax=Streptomyces poonensis TaxID=68255 RepID=A0A918UM62_9ACTN|nr:dihydrolipoamide acetyltransferase family protein [Streptomyces poonensis]GGZ19912.1 acetyltransferase component of pyruvate dehydrogenase complex [Streptomyces poonensis]
MAEFTMPSLGADMDEGLLQEWLVAVGDQVRKGDAIAVVETDKAAIEVECFEDGTVGRLLVEPGTRVPVGTSLAVIETGVAPALAPASAPVAVAETGTKAGVSGAPEADGRQPPAEPAPAHRPLPVGTAPPREAVVVGPLVRHLAEQKHLDLAGIRGTGRGGRVTRRDVERATVTHPRVRATPYARRLAGELHVDLAQVRGSGELGAVRAADVRTAARTGPTVLPAPGPPAAAAPPSPTRAPAAAAHAALPRPEPFRTRPATASPTSAAEDRTAAMRKAIAALMARSKREIPHYYLSTTVDLDTALTWLHTHNNACPVAERLLPAAPLLKAAALAARQVPELNGFWTDGHFEPGDGVHLGVAVSLRGGGLLTPVLHGADTLGLPALMAALKDLAVRARTGRLRGSELTGATLTVTSLGEQGVETVFGVIHPPQVALVGFGAVTDRPCAVNGLLGVRPMVTATLAADHRASDGAVGARYLTTLNRLLQHPEEL